MYLNMTMWGARWYRRARGRKSSVNGWMDKAEKLLPEIQTSAALLSKNLLSIPSLPLPYLHQDFLRGGSFRIYPPLSSPQRFTLVPSWISWLQGFLRHGFFSSLPSWVDWAWWGNEKIHTGQYWMNEQEERISESRFATALPPDHILVSKVLALKSWNSLHVSPNRTLHDQHWQASASDKFPFIHQHKILCRVCRQAMLLISSPTPSPLFLPIPIFIRLSFVITAVSISWDRALKRKRGGGGVRLEWRKEMLLPFCSLFPSLLPFLPPVRYANAAARYWIIIFRRGRSPVTQKGFRKEGWNRRQGELKVQIRRPINRKESVHNEPSASVLIPIRHDGK